jgi:hypothetical protein
LNNQANALTATRSNTMNGDDFYRNEIDNAIIMAGLVNNPKKRTELEEYKDQQNAYRIIWGEEP